jgi:xylose isomerase
MKHLFESIVNKLELDRSQWLDVLHRKEEEKMRRTGSDATATDDNKQKLDTLLEFLRKTDENFVFCFDNVDRLPDGELLAWVENLLDSCLNIKVMMTCVKASKQPSKYEFSVLVEGL